MSEQISLPQRRNSRYARAVFYENINDVDFFIEDSDENTRKIFLEILQRLFGSTINISKVHSLGGRDNVLDTYRTQNNQRTNGRNRKQIFIIDSDLFLLFEDNVFEKGLVKLNKYCIENYLFDFDAIHELLYDECIKETDITKMIEEFNLIEWWNINKEKIANLFIEYSIDKMNKLGIQTVKYSVHNLKLESEEYNIDNAKITNRLSDIQNKIKRKLQVNNLNWSISNELLIHRYIENDETIYSISKENIIKHIENNQLKCEDFISAKDYIFPLLFNKIKKYSASNLSDHKINYRLSKSIDLGKLDELIRPHLDEDS